MVGVALLLGASASLAIAPIDQSGGLRPRDKAITVTVTGLLSRKVFPGPPNHESVAKGDAPEAVLILKLPHKICFDDGGEFSDPAERFDTVQVSLPAKIAAARLIGRQVTVRGEAMGAHTGHHHAPMVVFATSVNAYENRKIPD